MKRLVCLLLLLLVAPAAQGQEVQKPVMAVGDWCEYDLDGVGVSKQRREVIEVAADGGYTQRFTDEEGVQIRVFNANGQWIRTGQSPVSDSGGGIYPISAKLRGRVSKYSRPHTTRPGVIVEVTSVVRSVEPEKVSVPFGNFDTLRVEFVSDYRFGDGSYANQFVDTVWYALDPKMKYPVKLSYIDYGTRKSSVTRVLAKCSFS